MGPVHADAIQLTPAQMREDLTFLKTEWAPLDKSFSEDARRQFEQHVDETAAKADGLTPDAFALEVMRAVALARNGHTNTNVGALLGDDLPIRIARFSDGLHIVKAHPDFARLLGARIDTIGTLTTEDAAEKLKAYLPGTDARIRFLTPGYLETPAVLKQIGAIADAAKVQLTLRLADGTVETVELQPVKSGDPGDERKAKLNRGYAVLIPDDADLPGRWPHVLDGKTDLAPIYGKRSDVQAQFVGDDETVLYIRNDSAQSVDETPLVDKFAGVFFQHIFPRQPKNIVVDLRLNSGGDLFNTILFSQALPRLVPEDGRVFVLVGNGTFSAGITTAAMLKGHGGDKVVLIGETMGDATQFWSDGKYLDLPHSQIAVRYSPEFHDYETGCFKIGACYWAVLAFGPRGISIAPETTVGLSFEDYAAGRDPVLDAALEQAGITAD